MVWREQGEERWLCAHCVDVSDVDSGAARNGGYRALINHLWRSHGIRRSWITSSPPAGRKIVQLAFDVALPHHTQFRNGGQQR